MGSTELGLRVLSWWVASIEFEPSLCTPCLGAEPCLGGSSLCTQSLGAEP